MRSGTISSIYMWPGLPRPSMAPGIPVGEVELIDEDSVQLIDEDSVALIDED